jgi:hypothetical protein
MAGSTRRRPTGDLRICGEYLQPCEQADLLPDQRWVQLISLDRHGLEMKPRWRNALSARNVVALSISHTARRRPDHPQRSHDNDKATSPVLAHETESFAPVQGGPVRWWPP